MKMSCSQLIEKKRRREKITMLTSYDYQSACLEEEHAIDVQLVGDSVGTNVLGHPDVRHVRMEEILHHVTAVARGVRRSFLLADMPYRSFETPAVALENARRCIDAGADGVKMEGEFEVLDQIRHVTRNGIAVCGHIGYTPQTNGPRASVQGKDFDRARELLTCARELSNAGIRLLVLELIPEQLAGEITALVPVPTIGIGAGRLCDGQVQVIHDIAGLTERVYRHAKAYDSLRERLSNVIAAYKKEVVAGEFPGERNTSKLPDDTFAHIREWIAGGN